MYVRQLLITFVKSIHTFPVGHAGEGIHRLFRSAVTPFAPQNHS